MQRTAALRATARRGSIAHVRDALLSRTLHHAQLWRLNANHVRHQSAARTATITAPPQQSINAGFATRRDTDALGSVRKEWRDVVRALTRFPVLQRAALETASFFTRARELEFGLPRTFDDTYVVAEKLGEGAFGHVHRVVARATECKREPLDLCVKIVPKALVVSRRDYCALQQEGQMMALLGGTLNVVHFCGAYEDDAHVYLVMEHCVGGDVSTRLLPDGDATDGTSKRPSEALVALYMTDILHVVWQCHLLRILHGDVKLENFVFADATDRSPLKLTDFGGAAFLHSDDAPLRELRGTPLYTAPEVLAGSYALPADVWSCGVILYRLLAGRFPFVDGALLDERIQFDAIDFDGEPWADVSQDALALVRGLLERDVSKRLTAEQALQHPWLARARATVSESDSESAVADLAAVATTATATTTATAAAAGLPLPAALLDGTLVQRLQFYRSRNSFQQAVFARLAHALPLAHKQNVVVLFSDVSRDGALQVDVDAFAAYVARGGYRLTRGEAKSFVRDLDLDGDGFIALDEFCAALIDWSAVQTDAPALWDALVTQAFADLDSDSDGQLAIADLARLVPFDGTRGGASHSFRSDVRRCFRAAGADAASGLLSRDAFAQSLRVDHDAFAHFAKRLA